METPLWHVFLFLFLERAKMSALCVTMRVDIPTLRCYQAVFKSQDYCLQFCLDKLVLMVGVRCLTLNLTHLLFVSCASCMLWMQYILRLMFYISQWRRKSTDYPGFKPESYRFYVAFCISFSVSEYFNIFLEIKKIKKRKEVLVISKQIKFTHHSTIEWHSVEKIII